MAIKVIEFYLLFVYLFCIKLSKLDHDIPIDPVKEDFYQKEQFLDYGLCKCDNLRPEINSNQSALKNVEIDGLTFNKNELPYVGIVYLRTEENFGHPENRSGLSTFVPLCRGILLNSKFALTTATCAKSLNQYYLDAEDEDNYEFVVASNHNMSEYYKEFDKLNVQIIGAKIHEDYDEKTGHANLALLELQPLKLGNHSKFGIDLFPGCLQDEINFNLNSLYSENTFYTIVNELTEKYKKEYDFNHTTDFRDNLLAAEDTQPKFIKVSVRELKPGGDPHCASGYFCVDSKFKGLFCPSDNGFPLMIYNRKNFRLELIGLNDYPVNKITVELGIVTGDNECRKYEPNRPITFVEIYPHLNWILSTVKKVCITPELIRKKQKFCSCKNHEFGIKSRITGSGIKSRVIGGTWVKGGDFEYVGYFSGSNYHFGTKEYTVRMFCTTVLLNRKFSLTTANCIHDKEKERKNWVLFIAYGGSHIKSQIEGDTRYWRYIEAFHPHPKFKILDRPTMFHENDIGLIEHMTSFDYGDDGDPPLYIQPACLQDHDPYAIARNVKETFKFSYGLGYGHIQPVHHTYEFHNDWRMFEENQFKEKYIDGSSNILQRAFLKYHGRGGEACQKKYKDKPIFCFKKGKGQMCKNLDLGSPLVRLEVRNNKFYVSGIAFSQDSNKWNSTHWHPCTDEARMRYVNVYEYLDFITNVTGYDLCWTNGPYNLAFNSV